LGRDFYIKSRIARIVWVEYSNACKMFCVYPQGNERKRGPFRSEMTESIEVVLVAEKGGMPSLSEGVEV